MPASPPPPIRLPVPAGDGLDALADCFRTAIGPRGEGPLGAALDLLVDPHDPLMVVDRVELTRIDLDTRSMEVVLCYTVWGSAFHACSDQHSRGQYSGRATGRRVGGHWVFAPHIAPEALAAGDEL